LWKRTYRERVLRKTDELKKIIRDVAMGPVRAGLASNPLGYEFQGSFADELSTLLPGERRPAAGGPPRSKFGPSNRRNTSGPPRSRFGSSSRRDAGGGPQGSKFGPSSRRDGGGPQGSKFGRSNRPPGPDGRRGGRPKRSG
jgi:hypothetical protein